MIASNEPFFPSGTSGQLQIGGVNLVSDAVITSLIRTDWQGVNALSQSSRTNLVLRSEPTKAQTNTPTAGTSDIAAPVPFGNAIHFSAAAQLDYFDLTCSGAVGLVNPIVSAFIVMDDLGAPVLSGSSTSGDFCFLVNWGGAVASSNIIITNLGSGLYRCSVRYTGTITYNHIGIYRFAAQSGRGFRVVGIQFEANPGTNNPTSYIKASGSATSVTDYTYTVSGAVTLGQTASGSYAWTGSGIPAVMALVSDPDYIAVLSSHRFGATLEAQAFSSTPSAQIFKVVIQ